MDNMPVKEKETKLTLIKKVAKEFIDLTERSSLNSYKNVVIDLTNLIKEDYDKDIVNFKMLTIQVGMIIDKQYEKTVSEKEVNDNCDVFSIKDENVNKPYYKLYIFENRTIESMEEVHIDELVGLGNVDINTYEYLNKCTFRLNTYRHDEHFNELDLIPAIILELR